MSSPFRETPAQAALPDDTEIPVLDLGPYLAGEEGALETLGRALRHACTEIGFYFVRNHGVPQAVIDAAFAAAARFHAQPLEDKLALKLNEHNLGYLPIQGSTIRHSDLNKNNKPDLAEGFFVKRELPADHPDVVANKRFRGRNRWPEGLPGFRETVLAYSDAAEQLALSLLPVYARALDLPADFFAPAFRDPQISLRLSHYPQQDVVAENEFGLAPHTDTGFLTLLAQNRVPGLAIRTRDGRWIDAPVIPGTFIVNGGDLLRRWTNDHFLATPHRVINRSGQERYAIPFFFDCTLDYPMTCLPSCTSAEDPPRYPPTSYLDYMLWQQQKNYDVLKETSAK
jgi:isopenicillin N synthase-like dioxygenase